MVFTKDARSKLECPLEVRSCLVQVSPSNVQGADISKRNKCVGVFLSFDARAHLKFFDVEPFCLFKAFHLQISHSEVVHCRERVPMLLAQLRDTCVQGRFKQKMDPRGDR